MSYDGTQLDWTTGERTKKHPFSAASKEVDSHLTQCLEFLANSPRRCKLFSMPKR